MRPLLCRSALALSLVSLSIALCGCSGAGSGAGSASGSDPAVGAGGAGGEGGEGGGSAGAPGGGGAGGSGGGVSVGPGNVDETDCGDVGKVIFVVTEENKLLSFDPPKLAFTTIGALSCPAGFGATPFSMAVDRNGTAFVLYNDGHIFRVSTKDASCQPTSYQAGQQGFSRFGMGYVSDAAGSPSETLFVIDGSSIGSSGNQGLGFISQQGQLAKIGQFDGGVSGRTAEVTGRGDGKLFAFFVDSGGGSGSSVAEIDKKTAHVLSNEPQDLPSISAWAFAHWGGSFYLFNGDGSSASRVHKYTPGKGTQLVVKDAGYSIVGAGVSTCAPTTEPIN